VPAWLTAAASTAAGCEGARRSGATRGRSRFRERGHSGRRRAAVTVLRLLRRSRGALRRGYALPSAARRAGALCSAALGAMPHAARHPTHLRPLAHAPRPLLHAAPSRYKG
jgi:hypothetical protein